MIVSRRPARWRLVLLALALLAPLSARAQGDEQKPESREHQLAHFASHDGNVLFLVAGVALPLLRDGGQGKDHALRVVDSLATTALLTEGLKALTKEKRPDSDEHNSFPSGHASAAFAVATMESAFHPKEAPLWFLGAATIGWSRIRLNRHYTHDVVAGALLGFGVARWEVPKTNGLILTPYINPKDRSVRLELGRGF
ncbi:MAG: phosphatase PAP2 family protein [Capsulimonas sp.]|uniref:phosphatase PAP2 family protein n=1 Tax=Capsulimonas sp. TaxID=2494211 RepID=UPI003263C70B